MVRERILCHKLAFMCEHIIPAGKNVDRSTLNHAAIRRWAAQVCRRMKYSATKNKTVRNIHRILETVLKKRRSRNKEINQLLALKAAQVCIRLDPLHNMVCWFTELERQSKKSGKKAGAAVKFVSAERLVKDYRQVCSCQPILNLDPDHKTYSIECRWNTS